MGKISAKIVKIQSSLLYLRNCVSNLNSSASFYAVNWNLCAILFVTAKNRGSFRSSSICTNKHYKLLARKKKVHTWIPL